MEFRNARVPIGGRWRERALDRHLHVFGQAWPMRAKWHWAMGEPLPDDGLRRRAHEGHDAREHLIHDAREAELVAAWIQRALTRGLLGTHVCRSPKHEL